LIFSKREPGEYIYYIGIYDASGKGHNASGGNIAYREIIVKLKVGNETYEGKSAGYGGFFNEKCFERNISNLLSK